MISNKTAYQWAQNAHLLAGSTVVLLTFDLTANVKAHWIVAALFFALTAFKEFYYDEHFETANERGSSVLDFAYYQAGVMLGLIAHYGGHWLVDWL